MPWIVLDAEGDILANVLIPAGATVLDFVGGHVWATVVDEMELPYVVRYATI